MTNILHQEKETMSNRKFAAILASPILAPLSMAPVIMFGMFIACGWMLVATTFFTAAGAAAVGIIGMIGAYQNVANGIGAVLLMLGGSLMGFGLVMPIFKIAKEFCNGFLVLNRELCAKAKELWKKAVKK